MQKTINYTPDDVEFDFGITITPINDDNSESTVSLKDPATVISTQVVMLENSQIENDNKLSLMSYRITNVDKNFKKRNDIKLVKVKIVDLEDNDAESTYLPSQKIGQFLLNITYAFSNTVWYPFALIPSPYNQMVETLATPLNATFDHLLDALFLKENPLSNFKTQEFIKNFVCNTTSLALTGCLGLLFGKYVAPDSESYALQFLALYLNETGLRQPFLYTIGYFGNYTMLHLMLYSWERLRPSENKTLKEHPKLNSGQQLGRYLKRGELPIAIINYITGSYSIETRFWMIKSLESIIRPAIYFSYTLKPVKNLNPKRGFIEQCGPQYLPENLDENEGIISGAFFKTSFYVGFAFTTYVWMEVVNYNYPEMYEDTPNLFYLLSYGIPVVGIEFLCKNTGEIVSDVKKIANQLSTGAFAITTSLSSCSSSLFKSVKNIKETLLPNNEEKLTLLNK